MRSLTLLFSSTCLISLMACSGGSEPEGASLSTQAAPLPEIVAAPAPAQPPVAVAPSAPTVSIAKYAHGHCTSSETVYFDCTTAGGKTVSVCGGPASERLQYRFGKVGAPELQFPANPLGGISEFAVQERTHVRSAGWVLSFRNGDVRYEVLAMSGGGCCSDEEAAANNFEGIYVFDAKDSLVAQIACEGEAFDELEKLGEVGVKRGE